MDGLMGLMRRVAVVVACVPVLVLAGCSDDEPSEPVELPSLSPSAVGSASPSPSASESVGVEELPASEVEPEEFVRAWFEAYNELVLTGDGSRLRALSVETCGTCESIVEAYAQVYADGGEISIADGAPPVEVISLETEESEESSERVEVRVVNKANRGSIRQDAAGDSEEFPAETDTWGFFLTTTDGFWRVLEIGIE
ncbi:DUF6318 family protein [Nocardioides sp. AE5]|uniref:DUF6318 family protein n=1 Tax=Nocardioides sp. AE5 TaxID=2962573 RepID=UPI0028828AA8|nr:DUF6318 family protein [Nocardioides sp. AE5]MDT0201089.1 DUF6318 family protein [Nocardioides sp. AE5]